MWANNRLVSISVLTRKWESQRDRNRSFLSPDRSCRMGHHRNFWNSTEYGGGKWDITTCVRLERNSRNGGEGCDRYNTGSKDDFLEGLPELKSTGSNNDRL